MIVWKVIVCCDVKVLQQQEVCNGSVNELWGRLAREGTGMRKLDGRMVERQQGSLEAVRLTRV